MSQFVEKSEVTMIYRKIWSKFDKWDQKACSLAIGNTCSEYNQE